MTTLPDLATYDAVLFDLDGVLTPTADVHMHAWRTMFEELFRTWDITPPYTDQDYFDSLDGKQRADGVAAVLRSRSIEVPWGEPDDDPSADTVWGIGNRKNVVFGEVLARDGVEPYPGSVALVDALAERGIPMAVVSSSKNAVPVLAAAGLSEKFRAVIDGIVAGERGLKSKPAPDVFLAGAEALGVAPARTAAFEDATSGVASAAAAGMSLVVGVDRGAGAEALRAAGAHVVVGDLAEFDLS